MLRREPPPSLDPIEDFFAKWTRYSWFICVVFFACKVTLGWHFMSHLLAQPQGLPVTCGAPAIPPGDSDRFKRDTETNVEYCDIEDMVFDYSVFTKTVQSNFGLAFQRQWMSTFLRSMFYVGLMVGAVTFGNIADAIGRRPTFTLTIVLYVTTGILVAFMPSYPLYCFMRILEGVASGGFIILIFVYLLEQIGSRQREVVLAFLHVPFNIGHGIMPIMSYYLPNYQHFQLSISFPCAIFLLTYCILPPSPKWLFAKGKLDKAAEAMERICRFNRQPCEGIKAKLEASYRLVLANSTAESKTDATILDVFKSPKLLKIFLCMTVNYFMCGHCYYGINQFVGNMSGNIFLNVGLSGLVCAPISALTAWFMYVLSRKKLMMAGEIAGGVCMLAIMVVPEKFTILRVLLAVFGSSALFMTFIVIFLYALELFPTTMRTAALGTLSMMSRIGMIVAPIVNDLPFVVACIIFGSLPLISAFLLMFCPETKGKGLRNTFD